MHPSCFSCHLLSGTVSCRAPAGCPIPAHEPPASKRLCQAPLHPTLTQGRRHVLTAHPFPGKGTILNIWGLCWLLPSRLHLHEPAQGLQSTRNTARLKGEGKGIFPGWDLGTLCPPRLFQPIRETFHTTGASHQPVTCSLYFPWDENSGQQPGKHPTERSGFLEKE